MMVKSTMLALTLAALSGGARAQEPTPLPDFHPLVPEVQARAYPITPEKGYAVHQLKPKVYLVTDGGYQSMFVITGKGVVLFDAPPSMARHLLQAVSDVTREPITALVYSHAHVDHIGGAGLILQQRPGLRIIAEEGTRDFLQEMNDPDRPLPTTTFKDHETLKIGSMTAELAVGHWHSPSGDLFIRLPEDHVVMAVDAFSAGSVPFMGLDLSQNVDEYRKVFDRLLATDADVIVPGHHNNAATRADVAEVKRYVDDVISTAQRVQLAGDSALAGEALKKYGHENTYAVGRVLMDHEVAACAREITSRWNGKLDDVDVWAPSHCQTAIVYTEWDVGPHGHLD